MTTNQNQSPGHPAGVRAVHAVMDWAVSVIAYWGAAGLAMWPGSAREEEGMLAGWAVVLGCGAWLRKRGIRRVFLVEAVGFGALVFGMNTWAMDGLMSTGQMAYAVGWVVLCLTGWRAWRDRSTVVGQEPVAEPLRVLLVTAAALGAMLPMFTSHFLGGTDARWYTLMLHDFIEQWRTSGPPVFLGQGDYVWVGAVHPFRSAPVFMHVAGLWDWLTLRSLEVEALQHLTAITAALASAWGLYAAGVKLAPQRHWAVAAVAVMYVLSSAMLMPLYMADAYMTYLATAAFVWVLYGNARILVDGHGWVALAGGLSLAWMSHPPTAMQVTLLTAFLQVGGLVFRHGTRDAWARAAGGGILFLVLSAYYFTGMSELPQAPGGGVRRDLLQVMGLLAGWMGTAQVLLMRRSWRWGLAVAGAVVVLGFTCPPWAGWLVLLVLVLAIVRAVAGQWRRFAIEGREVLVLLGGILVTGLVMDALLRSGPLAKPGYPAATLQWAKAWSSFDVHPLKTLRGGDSPLEPGLGLWAAGLLAGWVAVRRRDGAVQLFFAAVLLMLPLVAPVPHFGDFLVEYIPEKLRTMTAAPMHLRTMPVLAAVLAFAGLLAGRAAAGERRRMAVWAGGVLVAVAVGWYAWQARIFVQRGWAVTSSAALSAQNKRLENAPMDRFVYDLLPMPSYFSHGKMDPRLEVRLLDDAGNLIYGPSHMVEAMEATGSQSMSLDTFPVHGRTDWLQIEPRFVLQPGEQRLLRFEFNPAVRIEGYLLFQSEHGYREYTLPESGMRRAFGTRETNGRVISLWNSGNTPEQYQMQFAMLSGNELGPGMNFARLTLSQFDPARGLIEVKSLNPWRVETRMPWSGQLETPRVYLPGYEVRVDGRRIGPARISASPDRLLQIAMPPGEHTVEVRYVGTWKLRAAGCVSLVAWIMLLAWLAWGKRRLRSDAGIF